jgi:hypothetical protein
MVYEKMYESNDQQPQDQDQESTTNIPPVSLQISDLVKVLEILDVVSKRGAIKADEFEVVGGIYNRIFVFLKSTGVIQERDTDSSVITEGTEGDQANVESSQEGQ